MAKVSLGVEPGSTARKTVIFVRHGESEYNKAIRETGEDPLIRDAPLTAVGRQQAASAQATLAMLRDAAATKSSGGATQWLLLSSPLRRALDTTAGVWPQAFWQEAGGGTDATRFEIWPALREVVTGCDDLGTSPKELLQSYPHLKSQLAVLPDVWWTVPENMKHLPADGEAMREAYIQDPDAFEDADDALIEQRLDLIIDSLTRVPEEYVVIVAHCDLIGQLTGRLGLDTPKGQKRSRSGWWLKNCECRMAERLLLVSPSEVEDMQAHKQDSHKNA
mmetsp:Transcript_54203/g.150796  ORF Transcript_54203/g.150796 Transcript_54203/m.150796 type:complete len:277 (-) Transcript_54203:320-1150(-)|eukprot:CAMPEP_0117501500 /NCGR_PEP_ID=MMETSP0784-20121206/23330_1 /TAXON_ID=39447 /ORGANISM="" /LENGTH=276 /DNA_ID=CAMNT_0005296755 /DNA_START=106 /DNA_END=936 /DNA_ORIENTATION=+